VQIDSLKSAPVLTDEPKCTECYVFLCDLTVLKEKYASKAEELDVHRFELDEMKAWPSLLGACTSCPVLHEKQDVSPVYARSLEAQLKAPIPTSCSTCEINVVKNMELPHYVDRLRDENDELRKMMGSLSGHEPQLRMRHTSAMMGKRLGQTRWVMELVRMRQRSETNQNHQKPTTRMPMLLSQIRLGTDKTQPQLHLCFLHKLTTSRNPSISRVTRGMSSLVRRERN
jgi:hypothetical protein